MRDEEDNTLLHWVAMLGKPTLVTTLIDHGVDVVRTLPRHPHTNPLPQSSVDSSKASRQTGSRQQAATAAAAARQPGQAASQSAHAARQLSWQRARCRTR